MKKLLIGLSVFIVVGAGAKILSSQFWGYDAINAILKERLFIENTKFSFENFVGSAELGKLLGYHAGDGIDDGFRNGDPNPTNMALWNLGFSSLASWFGQVCDERQPEDEIFKEIQTDVVSAMKAFCAWPAEGSRNNENLARLWEIVVGYDSPESEFVAWRDFLMSDEYSQESGKVVLEEALKMAWLNPYFLLRR